MYLCVCVENCRTNGNPALTSPFPRPVCDGHRVRLKPYSDRLMCMCVCVCVCLYFDRVSSEIRERIHACWQVGGLRGCSRRL